MSKIAHFWPDPVRSGDKVRSGEYTDRLARYASVKIFVSWSFDLIELHWDCEKHVIMFGCLCKALIREEGAIHLQNGEI